MKLQQMSKCYVEELERLHILMQKKAILISCERERIEAQQLDQKIEQSLQTIMQLERTLLMFP